MTHLPDQAAPSPRPRYFTSAVGWHTAWLGAGGLAALAHWWWFSSLGNHGLGVMLIPAAAGVVLAGGRPSWRHGLLLTLWAAAAGTASALTGGLAGPFGVWCLAPLAAATVFGVRRWLALAGALSAVTAVAVVVLQVSGRLPPVISGVDGLWLSLAAIASLAIGMASGLILSGARKSREARLANADLRDRAGEADRLSALIAAQPQMLLTVDPAGRVSNIAGPALDSLEAESLLRDGLLGQAMDPERAGLEDALAQAAEHGSARAAFAPNAMPELWLEAVITRLAPGRLLVAVSDRTDQHAREATLDQGRLDAESLNAGKSRFLANMSHELRTPLNAIIGFSDVMRTGMFGALTPKYAEYAGLIHESGGHLLDLINDVLDMSKIEAERFELSREEFDARDAVSAALRLMRLQADSAGISLRGVLATEPLEVYADRRALKQIVLNLLSNALKFTGRGGSVTVSARSQGDTLEVTVSDTGLGIASEDLERLGRPYEQAPDGRRRAGSTGLGLSLVRAFAELHGGAMSLESTLGEGTAVTVRLPVMMPKQAVSPPPPAPPPAPLATSEPEPRAAYPSNVIAFDPRR